MRLGSDTGLPLRGWQRRALVKYLATQPRDFLAVATPGLDAGPAGAEARRADFAGEEAARNVIRRVLATVGAEPTGDGVNIDSKTTEYFLRHVRFLPYFRVEN